MSPRRAPNRLTESALLGPDRHQGHGSPLLGDSQSRAVASVVQVDKPAVGAGMRFTRADVDLAKFDAAIAAYEDSAVPWLTETTGFCAARLYIDRRTGRSLTEGLWTDRAALAKNRAVAATIRTDTVAATGAAIRAVEEYQVVFISGGMRSITSAAFATVSTNGSNDSSDLAN